MIYVQTSFFESFKHKSSETQGLITTKEKIQLAKAKSRKTDAKDQINNPPIKKPESISKPRQPSSAMTKKHEVATSGSQKRPEFAIKESEISRTDTLYIGDLPSTKSESKLRKVFSFAGTIKRFDFIPSNRVVITFQDPLTEQNLIRCLTNHTIVLDDCFLRVKKEPWPNLSNVQAESSPTIHPQRLFAHKRLFIGNLPPHANGAEIKRMFGKFGSIRDVHINQRRNMGFISFEHAISAYNLLQHFSIFQGTTDFDYDGHQLLVEIAKTKEGSSADKFCVEHDSDTKLYIGNIPSHADKNKLRQMFSGFGKITEVELVSKNQGSYFGFISFDKAASARNLLQRSSTKDFKYDGTVLIIDRYMTGSIAQYEELTETRPRMAPITRKIAVNQTACLHHEINVPGPAYPADPRESLDAWSQYSIIMRAPAQQIDITGTHDFYDAGLPVNFVPYSRSQFQPRNLSSRDYSPDFGFHFPRDFGR